ncbi:DgyrCDS9970 [Dimorphilus gyrociliatus]|uniref:DgyrCDS9970 n=1 Tax=Dimorphilus gyrociliatus TaxID=2664684 RepID=A0A7I8W0V2_9ANNE|nr:DgyrCDS9970 [Dimorphilus gyrociliatus]
MTEKFTLHIEPASIYIPTIRGFIIYKVKNKFKVTDKKRRKKRSINWGHRICKVHVITDVQYYNFHGRNLANLVADVYSILGEVDLIYSTTDWLDKRIDFTLGVRLSKITVFTTNSSVDAINDNILSSKKYLETLSKRNFTGFCAGFGFTGRDFTKDDRAVQGLTYSVNPRDTTSGICAVYSNLLGQWRNVALMTSVTYRKPLTRAERLTTVAHELGHLMAALHDDPNDGFCSPKTSEDLYLMHPFSLMGDKPNNRKFSLCSKYHMRKILKLRWGCLSVEQGSSCGNGIVEQGEDCDCGSKDICDLIDPCCNSQCKFKYECSPLLNRCCTSDCKIEKSGKECSYESECQKASYCNGISSECPPSKPLPNGKICAAGMKACQNGICSASICIHYNLRECKCPPSFDPCIICCSNVTCEPLKPTVYKIYGSQCNGYSGYCDELNTCVSLPLNYDILQLNDAEIIFRNYRFVNNWFYVMFSITVLVLGVFMYLTSKQRDPVASEGFQSRTLSYKQLLENDKWALYVHQRLDDRISDMNKSFEMLDEFCRSYIPSRKTTAIERLKILFPKADDDLIATKIEYCEMERDVIKKLLFRDKLALLEGWIKYETYVIMKSNDVDCDKNCMKNKEEFCYSNNLKARRDAVKKYRAEKLLGLSTLFSFETGKSRYFKLPIENLKNLTS